MSLHHCHLRSLGSTCQTEKPEAVGTAFLQVMNRGPEAAEIWPKSPRKSVVDVVEKIA